MAVTVLVLWMFTLGVGLSLLVSSRPSASVSKPAAERQPAAAPQAAAPQAAAHTTATHATATHATATQPVTKRRRQDPYAPPSLQRARSEPLPGLRSLLEFCHPALAITGFGLWAGYVVSRNHSLAVIACCVLGATAAAGLTWFASNARKKQTGFSGKIASLHGACATITLVLAVLTVVIR